MSSSKRPASGLDNGNLESSSHKRRRKKARQVTLAMATGRMMDEESQELPITQRKVKATRGSRACTVCRRLKMKCVGAENGPPCKRCITGKHQCIFEESNRGKRSSKKHEVLTKSLKKMELTLETVMRSLNNPNLASIVAAGGLTLPLSQESRTSSPNLIDVTENTDPSASTASPQPSTTSFQNVMTQKTETLNSHSVVMQSPPSPHRDSITLTGQKPAPTTQIPISPRLNSLPDNSLNPLGLLAEASLATNRRDHDTQKEADELMEEVVNGPALDGENPNPKTKVGVASAVYFRPGPFNSLPLRRLFIERQVQPEMLSFTSTDEVIDLFKIYFENMSRHCPVLSPDFHTPSLVCAIASKFYTARPDLHSHLAFSVVERGYKSLEIVQAYLLLVLWGWGPVERFEQDKTWLLLGTFTSLSEVVCYLLSLRYIGDRSGDPVSSASNLHSMHHSICYTLDRSFSAQMGKPHSILEDSLIRSSASWYKLPETQPTDAGLVAYADLQRILSRSLDFLYSSTSSPSGLVTDTDYLLVIKTMESQIFSWNDHWKTEGWGSPGLVYVKLVMRFYLNYSMLVVNSFGLQNALERAPLDVPHFFGRCYSSAKTCATVIRDELGPQGYLRYAPDSHFVLTSYALIRTEFQPYMENEQRTLALVNGVVDTLQSVAISPSHTPALYSTFLRAVVSSRTGTSGGSSPRPGTAKSHGTVPPTDPHAHGHDLSGSPLNLASGPGAGPGNDLSWSNNAGTTTLTHGNGEMDLQNVLPFQLPGQFADSDELGSLSMDNIFSGGFWDNVLIPGYSSGLEGLSGGFVYGTGGSGMITPRRYSPEPERSPVIRGTVSKAFPVTPNTTMA
ncbi:hypothetical protein BS47DRAFT_1370877 [Hydnum rufescens UP504]|uniref:Zn(2)-C6 fungal-type domain-containing protein n=1 Tax=Hydnum rufescens UP504 TaxID=1448309 RepID=A0A9P6B793_9AGAM|nr:hypothetical protein BS47DRAFT_1370877 [Hydnum rufescens UP504]